ncbi:hypothetical protein TWF718_001444 [Orbilia javanica]|uniref:Uncharacterized protein n=1 Tax=Orbilia javanica TaxID=47235 RepID=A0AAN8RNB4_9PEZI
MCFRDSNVEYLDQPARPSSFKTETTTADKDAIKQAKAAEKAQKQAERERNAAIRRKMMYGAGGGAAFIG